MRSVDIISPGNDAGKLERSMVGFYEKFRPRLSGGIGIGRFQDMLFFHGLGFERLSLTVDLVGGYVDEPFDTTMTLGCLEQYVGAEDVALGEVE